MRWIKRGIGCLGMMMILGTVMFSVQVFTGEFQVASSSAPAVAVDASMPGTSTSGADFLTTANGASPAAEAVAHSMNRKADMDGFLAAPWIPVSYIHQSANESSLPQQIQRDLRPYIIKEYPSYKKGDVTDHTIRSQSNSDSRIQAFAFHVSKLTAG